MLGSIVSICTSGFGNQAGLERVQKFFANKDIRGFDRKLAESLEVVTARIARLDRDREDVYKSAEAYKGLQS